MKSSLVGGKPKNFQQPIQRTGTASKKERSKKAQAMQINANKPTARVKLI